MLSNERKIMKVTVIRESKKTPKIQANAPINLPTKVTGTKSPKPT